MSFTGSSVYATGVEYSGLNPNGTCGSYPTLANYNSGYNGYGGGMAPVPTTTQVANANIIVPNYGGIGYNALTRGSGCGGYLNRTQAYGCMDAQGNCTTNYISRNC